MGHIRRTVIEVAVIAAGGYFIYNNVISDEAKAKLDNMVRTVQDATAKIQEIVAAQRPQPISEEENEANREAVERQWESIGY